FPSPSPLSLVQARLRFGSSIGLPRRRNYAVAIGAPLCQFSLQPLGLVFQSHPAQFANALDEVIRPTLAFRGILVPWLFERHWHNSPPASFVVWLCRLRALQRCYIAVGPADRSRAARGRKSRRSRQTVSFDLLACLRKGTAVRRTILRRKIG